METEMLPTLIGGISLIVLGGVAGFAIGRRKRRRVAAPGALVVLAAGLDAINRIKSAGGKVKGVLR